MRTRIMSPCDRKIKKFQYNPITPFVLYHSMMYLTLLLFSYGISSILLQDVDREYPQG